MNNLDAYRSESVVDEYTHAGDLFWPESRVLSEYDGWLKEANMLDLGVGGGRTSVHFGGKVQRYVGIDYSEEMIAACRIRFADRNAAMEFQVQDARDLSAFRNGEFDFVLYSFNGIDYVDHESRMKVLSEVRRVTRRGGKFLFSTHNICMIDRHLYIPKTLNWNRLMKHVKRRREMIKRNGDIRKLMKQEWTLVNDPAHDFSLDHYHVRPSIAVRQVQDAGFGSYRVLSHANKAEFADANLDDIKDPWPHFLFDA